MWVWVSLPHATFGIEVEPLRDGQHRVVAAAPIARWAIGRDARLVVDYYRRKGAELKLIRDSEDAEDVTWFAR